jgi:hypothetical protein
MKKIFLIACYLIISVATFAQPNITMFSPSSGEVGSAVVITGTGFNTILNQNIVFFGATQATVTTASTTSLTVTVPLGATYQYISITNLADSLTTYSAQPFNVTLLGSLNLTPQQSLSASFRPIEVSVGDIDGDGKPDLAVANYSANSVSVFRNTSILGAVTFAPKVNFTTGDYPSSVSIGDINGDGKLDLVVANNDDGDISVFRNTSTLGIVNFDAKMDFSMGGGDPVSVRIGDIDEDGKPDLVIVSRFSNMVTILRNTTSQGSISFANGVIFSTGIGSSNPRSVRIGDIDGDGKPDLAVASPAINAISVFQNTSTIGIVSFASKIDIPTGDFPIGVGMGDIDGDGKPDLAAANYNDNTVSILRNTSISGSISFASKVDFATGDNPFSIKIGDIDGDGKPDLAIPNVSDNTVSLFKNNSSLGMINLVSKIDLTTAREPKSAGIADLDGDGKPDLVVTNYYLFEVSVFQQIKFPVITSFTPSIGCEYTNLVVIKGGYFTGATDVTFGGVNALYFVVDSSTQITALIGRDSTGVISVTTADGTVSSVDTFRMKTPPSITTSTNGLIISADQNNATYQWIDCSDSSFILGATNQDYTVTVDGNYAVIVTLNDCSYTSLCVNMIDVSIENISNDRIFSIYPNPFKTKTTFLLDNVGNPATFIVYNTFGKVVWETTNVVKRETVFDQGNLPNGVYFVHLIEQGKKVIAIRKIVLAN